MGYWVLREAVESLRRWSTGTLDAVMLKVLTGSIKRSKVGIDLGAVNLGRSGGGWCKGENEGGGRGTFRDGTAEVSR